MRDRRPGPLQMIGPLINHVFVGIDLGDHNGPRLTQQPHGPERNVCKGENRQAPQLSDQQLVEIRRWNPTASTRSPQEAA